MKEDQQPNSTKESFDVFLSHNSKDKLAVETLAVRLEDEFKLTVWLDKWNLIPGEPWQEEIERTLDQAHTCAVFLGPNDFGSWHHEEMRAALEHRVVDRTRKFRVIPALLPGAVMPDRGKLPAFLSRLTWVDMRRGLEDAEALRYLVAGVRGIAPGRPQEGTRPIDVECPYRGLKVFQRAHAHIFFGREAMTQHLVEALRPRRFLCVLGPSGSGKSSLARAGLLNELHNGKLLGSQDWKYLVFKPGAHPIEELALNLAALQTEQSQVSVAVQLISDLKNTETALHLFARLLLRDEAPDTQLFILLDQFEEVFTLCQDAAERSQFIKNLRYAGTIQGGRVTIVPTMRADFLGRAAESPDLAELLSSNQFIVSPLAPQELRHIIEKPAHSVGVNFEKGLVERILHDIGQEPGALPLLEHALSELFCRRHGNRMSVVAYEESGGVHGALAKKAEAIFTGFTPKQQAILRHVTLRMIQPGQGTADTRRRVSQAELWNSTEERMAIEQVIQTLANERLLTTNRDASGEEQVEIAHEALIQGWERLRKWVDNDRDGLRLHHRLSEEVKEWQKRKEDESYLYRGARLAQVIEWRQNNEADLSDSERRFIDQSVAYESRREEVPRIDHVPRLAVENSRDVTVFCDLDGQQTYISPGITAMAGWEPKDLIGRFFREFIHPADVAETEMAIRALQAGSEGGILEYRTRKRDGDYLWAEGSLRVYRDPGTGRPVGFLNTVRDITERKRSEEYLQSAYRAMEALALVDDLTGIANRRRFDEALKNEWTRAIKDGIEISVLIIDADHFKRFNDTYGYGRGDECLKAIAAAASSIAKRQSDLFARYGGTEFVLMMPSCDATLARTIALEIWQAIRSLNIPHTGNEHGVVTVSIGCATLLPKRGDGPQKILELASKFLYQAKQSGRDQVW